MNVSLKRPTSSVPSSTTEPAGSSRDATRTPNGTSPDLTVADRGGRNRTMAVSSAPGNSDSTDGSAMAHSAPSPTTTTENSSTTVPVLRTVSWHWTSPPGSTDSSPEE